AGRYHEYEKHEHECNEGCELRIRSQGVAETGALLILLGADAVEYAQGRNDDLLRSEAGDSRHRYFPIEAQGSEDRLDEPADAPRDAVLQGCTGLGRLEVGGDCLLVNVSVLGLV